VIGRYTRPEMGRVWSDESKIDCWLRVEIAACESWHKRGRIPDWAIEQIRTASCDLERMREIERETDHDLISFLRATGESIGDAARFVHLGLTSSDVVDTGLAMQAVEASRMIDAELVALTDAVWALALAHKHTVTIGRTHGIHAEPTTFGLKALVWYDELRRHRRRLALALEDIAVGQISGAVGTHAHVPPEIEEEVCEALGLKPDLASTQVIQRDRHAFVISVLAGIGATIEKIATEIRHLQRTEVREVQEPFGQGNQGSSAMPHKRNPHESERLSGLARLLRGYMVTAYENIALWHERDISHSSTERVVFPDAFILVDYSLHLLTEIITDLKVFPDRMRYNLELTGGLIYSQKVLLALVDAGVDRQAAYKIVQRNALAAWDDPSIAFADRLKSDSEVTGAIDSDGIDALMRAEDQLIHVDGLFDRVVADVKAESGTDQLASVAL
jgi:adenylosuccinate lyase